jgi:hypothetical protein
MLMMFVVCCGGVSHQKPPGGRCVTTTRGELFDGSIYLINNGVTHIDMMASRVAAGMSFIDS